MSKEAFITGSQIFGYATPESDVDLVLYMSYPDFCTMVEKMDVDLSGEDYGGGDGFRTIRVGNLNMICCWSTSIYDAFKSAKAEILHQISSARIIMTRDVSVEIHERHRQDALRVREAAGSAWFLG